MDNKMRERYELGERPCLTPAQIERLAILAEELGEAQQIVGKILRHGFFSKNPHQSDAKQNYELLERELGDVEFALYLLCRAGDIRASSIHAAADDKAERIKSYLHHQGDQQ